jgi:hypothetical protein
MADAKDKVADKVDRAPIFDDLKTGIESMMSSQFENWNRFWSRLGSDDYSFGKMTADMVRFWGTWAGGVANLAVAPLRRTTGDAVPMIFFLLDGNASAKLTKEIGVPSTYKFSGAAHDTLVWANVPDDIRAMLQLSYDYNEAERRISVSLNPPLFEMKDKWLSGTSANGVIFQERTPIASFTVFFT